MGSILARSSSGGCANPLVSRTSGKIVLAQSAAEVRELIKEDGGDILLCPVLTEDYCPILPMVRGVVCQRSSHISSEILSTVNPNLVWLIGVHDASRKLEPGLFVTIDGKSLLVYEGAL
jgi:pyruvate kinase